MLKTAQSLFLLVFAWININHAQFIAIAIDSLPVRHRSCFKFFQDSCHTGSLQCGKSEQSPQAFESLHFTPLDSFAVLSQGDDDNSKRRKLPSTAFNCLFEQGLQASLRTAGDRFNGCEDLPISTKYISVSNEAKNRRIAP